MKYPWDSEFIEYQCLRCNNYNFEDKYGTGPFTCIVFPQGIINDIMINEEACESFVELQKKS